MSMCQSSEHDTLRQHNGMGYLDTTNKDASECVGALTPAPYIFHFIHCFRIVYFLQLFHLSGHKVVHPTTCIVISLTRQKGTPSLTFLFRVLCCTSYLLEKMCSDYVMIKIEQRFLDADENLLVHFLLKGLKQRDTLGCGWNLMLKLPSKLLRRTRVR